MYVAMRDYQQWQDQPVVTSLKVGQGIGMNLCDSFSLSQDTDKQVKNTPFPSITICTEGINMDAIMDAVSEDFNVWLKEKRNYTYLAANHIFTQREHRNNVKEFLHDTYSISPSYNISLEDIALAYSSPDPEKYSSSNKNQRFRS